MLRYSGWNSGLFNCPFLMFTSITKKLCHKIQERGSSLSMKYSEWKSKPFNIELTYKVYSISMYKNYCFNM